jgi:hypothetical protein
LDYLGGFNVITRVLIRERRRQASQRMRCDDRSRCQSDAIAGWKRATIHGMQAASRSWKRKGNRCSGEPPAGMQSC